jgi:hypothetical protein
MLLDLEKFRPVRAGGIFLATVGVVGLLFCAGGLLFYYDLTLTEPRFTFFMLVITSGCHLITGLGIILQKMWGYYLMKLYLYLLLFAIPIGTYIALKCLRYIRDNQIEEFFRGKALLL